MHFAGTHLWMYFELHVDRHIIWLWQTASSVVIFNVWFMCEMVASQSNWFHCCFCHFATMMPGKSKLQVSGSQIFIKESLLSKWVLFHTMYFTKYLALTMWEGLNSYSAAWYIHAIYALLFAATFYNNSKDTHLPPIIWNDKLTWKGSGEIANCNFPLKAPAKWMD